MKRKLYMLVLFMFAFYLGDAQSNYYYYYNNSKVFLNLDNSSVTLITENDFQKSSVSTLNFKEFNLEQESPSANYKYSNIEFQQIPSSVEYFQKINLLNSNAKIIKANPNFTNSFGKKFGLSNYFYVKLKNASDYQLLVSKVLERNVIIVEQNQFMPLWYTLKITKNTIGNTLEVANQFFETGLFASSQPDFLSDDRFCSNDPMFGSLWGLNNTSNTNHDINICQAWNITQGANVNVAVLDQGIFKTHIDLYSNIHPLSYNTETNTSPSQLFGDHGTHCAGTIAAIKDNNIQVVGVSPLSKLMDISNSLAGTPNSRMKRADGINWAWQNGADIISNSWGSGVQYQVIDDAINNALQNGRNGKGTIIVFATGNNNNSVSYPANSNPSILSVGAMTSSGTRSSFSNYGTQLDVVAPGSNILSTVPNNQTASWDGTSMATPHVAGVAALILSVNPYLSAQQVSDIIEQTAQKVGGYDYQNQPNRPNGTWHEQMGYGLVDAYAAVKLAQNMYSTTLDLYIKDKPDDMGIEPNPNTQLMWTSKDIWIRNNDDGGLTHQNPEYRSNGSPNYIYVRIINKSSVPSTGNEILNLNWAKASTALIWPQNWDGSLQNSAGYNLGGAFPISTIPVLQPGNETIVKIPWVVPNPSNYSDNNEPWHFCLLARIDGIGDPLQPVLSSINEMAINDNNVAWTNITIVDLETEITGASVLVANPSQIQRTFFLELHKEVNESGKAIFNEAEVSLKMDDVLYSAWERGGKIAQKLAPTQEEKRKLVKGDNVILDNIAFNSNEMGLLTLDFNFLIKELTDKDEYTYHVVQKDANTGEVLGGETFIIRKSSRQTFVADAGDDKEVAKNETITISAKDINEPAVYNWYDSKGDLIYQGKDLTVTADVVEKYKLEVIATTDGFKDYASIGVKFKPNIIESISPNPALDNIVVNYKINEASSAYLMVLGYYGSGTSYNYILDVNLQEIQINTSSYQNGFYTVALVCDGEIADAKTLLKQ